MDVDLTGVYHMGVDLTGVYLMGVDLTGVHLMGVDLTGVYLIGVDLVGVCLIMCLMRVSHRHASHGRILRNCSFWWSVARCHISHFRAKW
jgi:uncharacterized protein YjbI with pentapeptide repeats